MVAARLVGATLVEAPRGVAARGKGAAWPAMAGLGIGKERVDGLRRGSTPRHPREARQGRAWQGRARRRAVWQGSAGDWRASGTHPGSSLGRPRAAGRGLAGRGRACPGAAWQVQAWRGQAGHGNGGRMAYTDVRVVGARAGRCEPGRGDARLRPGVSRRGMVWHGWARHGFHPTGRHPGSSPGRAREVGHGTAVLVPAALGWSPHGVARPGIGMGFNNGTMNGTRAE